MSDSIEIRATRHITVLRDEVAEFLVGNRNGVYVDGTLGGGGHTERLAERLGEAAMVVGIDRDAAALARAERRLAGNTKCCLRFVHADFRYLTDAMTAIGLTQIDGLILDLGMSSDQLADRSRGFAFDADGPLDLRFDDTEGEPAHKLLARWTEREIADVIFRYGEERFSRRIAARIIETRLRGNAVHTARELADLVARCVPRERRTHATSIHPATRTFQGLRIAVNDELGSLTSILQQIPAVLAPGGRVAIISFHSLEDRIVKHAFRDSPALHSLTKKPITASDEESRDNPRARSAKLRVAERK